MLIGGVVNIDGLAARSFADCVVHDCKRGIGNLQLGNNVIMDFVVLSRVKRLSGLILNEKLDEYRSYQANDELVRWERIMKERIEKRHSKIGIEQILIHN